MEQIISKILAWGFAVKTHKWTLEGVIANAADTELDGIDVESGWPD